jgi:hypothetical protein
LKKQEIIKKVYETLRQKKYWEDKARYMEEYIKAYMNHENIVSKLMDVDKKKLESYLEHCKKIYEYKEQKNNKVETKKEEPKENKKENNEKSKDEQDEQDEENSNKNKLKKFKTKNSKNNKEKSE